MNHLVGLPNVRSSSTSQLSTTDAEALTEIKRRHNAAKPINFQSDDEPKAHIDPTSLPPCGWRPLDDATLYRFLEADRRHGKFQIDASYKRLQKALHFRKREGVDAYNMPSSLCNSSSDVTARKEGKARCKRESSPRSVVSRLVDRSDSAMSSTSIASGIVSDCGEKVLEVVERRRSSSSEVQENETSSTSCTMVTFEELDRYQKLRVRVFVGLDHASRPVMFERLGHFLGSGNCDHFTERDWIRLYIWDLERHFVEMRKASEASGKAVQRYTYVADVSGIVEGVLNRKVWRVVPLLKALIKSVEMHYPEIAERIILINVPRIASAVYKAVRKLLDPVTAAKVELHPGVPMGELMTVMSKDTIPVEYGGTNSKVVYPPAVTEA